MQKDKFITAKDYLGYAEEYLIINSENNKEFELLKFSLSNSLDDIKNAIYARTGHNIDLDKAYWRQYIDLPVSAKHLMDSQHVNFSVTTMDVDKGRLIIVIMRANKNKWFETKFFEMNGKIHSFGSWFHYLAERRFPKDSADDENEE